MYQFFHNIAKKKEIDTPHFNSFWQMVSCLFMLQMLYLPLLNIYGSNWAGRNKS